MAQWINVLWNNSFINLTRLPLLCRNFKAIALAEPGLMAGRLAGKQNEGKFEFLKFISDQIFKLFAVFNKGFANSRRSDAMMSK